jgi:hypothetical protein
MTRGIITNATKDKEVRHAEREIRRKIRLGKGK